MNRGMPGLPWSGGGPWRISQFCEASRHNSLRHGRSRAGGPRCTCPRAVLLVAAENLRRRMEGYGKMPQKRKPQGGREPRSRAGAQITGAWVPQGVRVPDLSEGLCRQPFGMKIVDKVLTLNGGAGSKAVQEHRDLCSSCPVLDRCKDYITKAEVPAGSWHGVWGGMSQGDRRALAREGGKQS